MISAIQAGARIYLVPPLPYQHLRTPGEEAALGLTTPRTTRAHLRANGRCIYFKSGSEAPTHSITGAQIRDLFGISDDNLVFLAPHDYEAEADSYEVEVTADDGAHIILRSSGAGLTIETLR